MNQEQHHFMIRSEILFESKVQDHRTVGALGVTYVTYARARDQGGMQY